MKLAAFDHAGGNAMALRSEIDPTMVELMRRGGVSHTADEDVRLEQTLDGKWSFILNPLRIHAWLRFRFSGYKRRVYIYHQTVKYTVVTSIQVYALNDTASDI
jgi:hypothetical protein